MSITLNLNLDVLSLLLSGHFIVSYCFWYKEEMQTSQVFLLYNVHLDMGEKAIFISLDALCVR